MSDAAEWRRLVAEAAVVNDASVVAVNKPVGVSVTGERHGTDLVRMASDAGETLYPVHRIDKATSGLVMFARELAAHGPLTRQFQQRTAEKTYLAVTAVKGLPDRGVIDLPLSIGRKNRVRVAARREAIIRDGDSWTADTDTDGPSYPSLTRFVVLWRDRRHTLLAVRPVTGRRHQIRVHLAWIGHAIAGDPLFDAAPTTRMLLHSWRLALDATWIDGERWTFEASPGADFLDAAGITAPEKMFAHAETLLPRLAESVADEP